MNLSPVQIEDPNIVRTIAETLLNTGLSPRRLELEVTESAIISDKARGLQVLRQIRALGISIAIDDFGTGYSSLDTLNSFPFDKIKIDRSFLATSTTNSQSLAIIRAVLALGRSLGMPVLAEGVETQAQLDLLRAEGCEQAQGYLLGRPQVRSEIATLASRPRRERLIVASSMANLIPAEVHSLASNSANAAQTLSASPSSSRSTETVMPPFRAASSRL